MSSLTDNLYNSAINKSTSSSINSTVTIGVVNICPVQNKECSTKCRVSNIIPSVVTGEFGWKKCNICKTCCMDACCNHKCQSNDRFKRAMSDELQEMEQHNSKFQRNNCKVVCVVCGMTQSKYDELIEANLSIEDESGKRYYDDEGATQRGIVFQHETSVHKRNEFLTDIIRYENNTNIIKSFMNNKKKRKLNNKIKKELLIVNPELVEKIEGTNQEINSIDKSTDQEEHSSSTFTTITTGICTYELDSLYKPVSVSKEDAKKAILDNIDGHIHGKEEYKHLIETNRLLNQLREDGSTALEEILHKDVALPKKISKLISNFNGYIKVFHDLKSFTNSKKLRYAVAMIKELCQSHPSTFVSYQRIYDVSFSYSDAEDLNIQIDEKEDRNNITLGKFLNVCQNLGIFYSIPCILTHNFLMSACVYLINRFAVYRKNSIEENAYIITEKNIKTLTERASKQIKLYSEKVDIYAVESKLQKKKTIPSVTTSSSSSSSSSSSIQTVLSVGLDLSIIIPSVILIMACENMTKPCTFHISGQEMAKVINYSDSTISSTKALMLIEKNNHHIVTDKENIGLHKKKKNGWIIDR